MKTTTLQSRRLLFAVLLAFMCLGTTKAQTWGMNSPSKNIFPNNPYNNVGIGTESPTEKLHVLGNLKVQGEVFADSMQVSHILGADDSTVHIGHHSIIFNYNSNVISWTAGNSFCFTAQHTFSILDGLAIANGTSYARGQNSMVFGNNVNVSCGIANAYVMGNGLTNGTPNSYMLGWGIAPTMFADATGVAINQLTGHTQTLDVNGTERVRNLPALANPPEIVVADANGFLQSLAFTNNPNQVLLGNGTFGPVPASNNTDWVLAGNINANNFSKLGATSPSIPLNIYAGNQQRQYIDGVTGYLGIGTGFSTPTSLLHLNTAATGNMFRSDGLQTLVNQWQLFTGTSIDSMTEKFNVTALANTNNVQITAPQGNLILKDSQNQITLAEITALKQEVEELKKKCWS